MRAMTTSLTSSLAQPPRVFFVEPVEQRFQLFHTFTFLRTRASACLKKRGASSTSHFGSMAEAFAHVFFGGEDKFV